MISREFYCGSEGLGSVFRGTLDTQRLGDKMQLPEGQSCSRRRWGTRIRDVMMRSER